MSLVGELDSAGTGIIVLVRVSGVKLSDDGDGEGGGEFSIRGLVHGDKVTVRVNDDASG
jgi:uncharacterized protein (DUF39 family)